MSNTNDPTFNDLLSQLVALKAENARLQGLKTSGRITLKVSEKGAISMYGMGKWPVTLYREQWEKVFSQKELVESFITANSEKLSSKADAVAASAVVAPKV